MSTPAATTYTDAGLARMARDEAMLELHREINALAEWMRGTKGLPAYARAQMAEVKSALSKLEGAIAVWADLLDR